MNKAGLGVVVHGIASELGVVAAPRDFPLISGADRVDGDRLHTESTCLPQDEQLPILPLQACQCPISAHHRHRCGIESIVGAGGVLP